MNKKVKKQAKKKEEKPPIKVAPVVSPYTAAQRRVVYQCVLNVFEKVKPMGTAQFVCHHLDAYSKKHLPNHVPFARGLSEIQWMETPRYHFSLIVDFPEFAAQEPEVKVTYFYTDAEEEAVRRTETRLKKKGRIRQVWWTPDEQGRIKRMSALKRAIDLTIKP